MSTDVTRQEVFDALGIDLKALLAKEPILIELHPAEIWALLACVAHSGTTATYGTLGAPVVSEVAHRAAVHFFRKFHVDATEFFAVETDQDFIITVISLFGLMIEETESEKGS